VFNLPDNQVDPRAVENPYADPAYAAAAMEQSDRLRGSTVSVRDRPLITRRRGHIEGRRRPGVRRGVRCGVSRSSSRSTSRGDPDLGEEPPGHRSPSRLGVVWA
jgi:hypothetical protein